MTSQQNITNDPPYSTSIFAIVPAAGTGTRMQSETPKQYLKIGAKTVLELSIEALLSANQIQQIVVCLAADDGDWPALGLKENNRIHSVTGGASRAQSVFNGLTYLLDTANEDDWVIVHDAARPCLSGSVLQGLINELEGDEVGGILGIPARDTLKQVHMDSEYIHSTLNRAHIWQAQTPQMFRLGLLYSAMKEALARKLEVTDEASAMEAAGLPVKLIKGDSRNIKITTPEDLLFARSVIEIGLQ